MLNTTTFTASEARTKLYSLIKQAATGLKSFEIKLRGTDSVVLVSKDELESWQETLDILSNPEEANNLRTAMKQKKTVSHKQMLEEIGLS